eukprot:Rhum_TRINITY_DN14634_c5_g1::Rhum_TRINITY_DN14634_c5_g1_i1::g.104716::m.104716
MRDACVFSGRARRERYTDARNAPTLVVNSSGCVANSIECVEFGYHSSTTWLLSCEECASFRASVSVMGTKWSSVPCMNITGRLTFGMRSSGLSSFDSPTRKVMRCPIMSRYAAGTSDRTENSALIIGFWRALLTACCISLPVACVVEPCVLPKAEYRLRRMSWWPSANGFSSTSASIFDCTSRPCRAAAMIVAAAPCDVPMTNTFLLCFCPLTYFTAFTTSTCSFTPSEMPDVPPWLPWFMQSNSMMFAFVSPCRACTIFSISRRSLPAPCTPTMHVSEPSQGMYQPRSVSSSSSKATTSNSFPKSTIGSDTFPRKNFCTRRPLISCSSPPAWRCLCHDGCSTWSDTAYAPAPAPAPVRSIASLAPPRMYCAIVRLV